MIIRNTNAAAASTAWLHTGYGPKIMLSPEGGAGSGSASEATETETEVETSTETEVETPAPADENKKTSDAEAKLLKELMDKKTKLKDTDAELKAAKAALKAFEGLDATEVRALAKAAKDAEAAKLEAAGEFESVKKMMKDAHAEELAAMTAAVELERSRASTLAQQIDDLTIGNEFATSKFIAEELVLTPKKARKLYGEHFERVDGEIVAYDKPATDPTRKPLLVKTTGDAMGFEQALRALVEADPDRDELVRSKMKKGTGSNTDTNVKPATKTDGLKGVGRLQSLFAEAKEIKFS